MPSVRIRCQTEGGPLFRPILLANAVTGSPTSTLPLSPYRFRTSSSTLRIPASTNNLTRVEQTTATSRSMSADSDLDVAVVCSTRVRLLVEAGMRSVEDEVRNRYGDRGNVLVGDPVTAFARRIGRKSGPPSVWQRIRTEGIPIPLSARAKARHG